MTAATAFPGLDTAPGLVDEHGVVDVVLTGGGPGNVLGDAGWSALAGLTRAVAEHPCARIVVLRGAGGTFCRGTDLRWYLTRLRRAQRRGPDALTETAIGDTRRIRAVLDGIAGLPVSTAAVIDGECTGAGLELAAACDIRVATTGASFSLPETDLGFVPDLGAMDRLPRIVGDAVCRELTLTGRVMDAAEALRWGLVTAVLSGPDEEQTWRRAVVQAVARKERAVLTDVKNALDAGHHRTPVSPDGSGTDPARLDRTIRLMSRRLAGPTGEGTP